MAADRGLERAAICSSELRPEPTGFVALFASGCQFKSEDRIHEHKPVFLSSDCLKEKNAFQNGLTPPQLP